MDLFDELLTGSFPDEGGANKNASSSLYDLDPRSLVTTKANEYGVPVNIALALTNQESGFDNNAVSPKKARGLMQLMDGTAKDLGVDPTDPVQNVDGGMRYLKQNYDKFGDWDLALAAYHAGPGAVSKAGGIPNTNDGLIDTSDYVKGIRAKADRLGGIGESAPQQGSGDLLDDLMGVQRKDQPKSEGGLTQAQYREQVLSEASTEGKAEGPKYGRIPLMLSKGVANIVGGLGWLTGVDEVEQWGNDREKAILEEQMKDPEVAQALTKFGEAHGLVGALKVFKDEPLAVADIVIGSLPSMAFSMGAAKGVQLARILTGNAAAAAGLTAGATAQAVAAAATKYGAIAAAAGTEGLITAGSAGSDVEAALIAKGMSPEEAKEKANDAAIQVGVATTLLSMVGDARLEAGVATGAGLKGKGVSGVVSNVVAPSVVEGTQETVEDTIVAGAKGEEGDPGKSFGAGFAAAAPSSAGLHAVGRMQDRAYQRGIPTLDEEVSPQDIAQPQPQDRRPSDGITSVDVADITATIGQTKSVDEAVSVFMDRMKQTEVKASGVDLDTLSRVDAIKQVADTEAMRNAMGQMDPIERTAFLSDLDAIRSGDTRVPNAARVQATERVHARLEGMGALEQAQAEISQAGLKGTLEDAQAIEQGNQMLARSEFSQFANNQPANVKSAVDATVAQINNEGLPESVRAEAATRLVNFATQAGLNAETQSQVKAEEVKQDPAQQFETNRSAVQAITASPEWKAHVKSLPQAERSAIVAKLSTITNPKISAAYRNGVAADIISTAESAGIGIPSTGAAIDSTGATGSITGAATTGRVGVSDVQGLLSRAKFTPTDGVVKLADPNAPRPGTMAAGQMRILQVFGRALGREVAFFEQDGNTTQRDGFVLPENPNVIFLNSQQSGTSSVQALMGHELLHTMPDDIKQQFIQAVSRVISPESATKLQSYINQPDLDQAGLMEEIGADLFGNGFNRPELIAEALKDMPVSAAQKLLQHVRQFIAKMIQKLNGSKDFETGQYVSDLKALDKAWVEAFREFLARENSGQGMINGRPAESFSMEELAELMANKESPLAEKAEAELARRSTYPDYDSVDQLANAAGKKKRDWNGLPLTPKKAKGPVETSMKDRLDAQIEARKKRDRGELLTPTELEAATAPDVQAKPDAKIEVEGRQPKVEQKQKTGEEPLTEAEQDAIELELEQEQGETFTDDDVNEDMPIKYSARRADFVDPEERSEVSTTKPSAVKSGDRAYNEKLVIDKADITASKKHVEAIGKAIADYNTLSGKGDASTMMEELHKVVVDNLLWLHDKVPAKIRDRAKLWYDGANVIATDWTKKYNLTERQSAGVLAVLSPQMDWFKNVTLAERVITTWQRQDQVWTPAMTRWAETWAENAPPEMAESRQAVVETARRLEGTPLFEMNDSDAARFVRAFDETYNERAYRLVTPEGGFGENATNTDDGDSSVTWGGFDTIEKAVSILRDGSFRNVDTQLGGMHKVRNFYNNIIAPNSEDGHVTIDTHAIGAALMKTVSGASKEVMDNFGKAGQSNSTGARGTYALFADAYRDAAAKRGLLAREMQSITWEAIRVMFPAAQKRVISPAVNAVWDQFREGTLTREQARKQVEKMSAPISEMSWDGFGNGQTPADGGTSFAVPETIDPNVGRTLPTSAAVSMSASTQSIVGLSDLTRLANRGDKAAHALLQDVAMDSLRHLLSKTDAKVKFDRATGLFEGEAEPSVGVSVTFTDDQQSTVLAALAKFADNFNQKQIHVRRGTSEPVGTTFPDGSYATPVYRWDLTKALSRKQVQSVIDASGLYGLTFGDNFVEAYYVGDPENDASIAEFESNIQKADLQIGKNGGSLGRTTQRLWPYGEGGGAIGYERIAGDVPTGPASSVETARRIANYLNNGDRVAAFDQAPTITEEQDALQSEIAQTFAALPVNDLKNPVVRKAYNELKKETIRQFKSLPIKVEVFNGTGEPYANSAEMRADILDNNHLFIYATTPETFGPEGMDFSKHPLLAETGISDANGVPMVANDLFRAIHDYFAHGMSETQFGPKGEEAAWKNHMAATNNPWARWALTMETRGQNSWVNFNAELDRSTPIKDRAFADQKAALLPVDYTLTGDAKTDSIMRKFIKDLPESQRRGSLREEIKFSSARGQITPVWQAPEPSKMDNFLFTIQDKQIDMRRAVEAVKEAGRQIADKFDPYLQETLYHGRSAKGVKDFLDHEMKPLLQSMQAAKVDIVDLNEFMHMRHAEERNIQIAKINPAMPDAGSGVTTAAARKYLASLSPTEARTLESLARRVDRITKSTRDMMVASGLETQDTINEWERTYKKYVPLMREDVGASGLGAGQGFSVKGASSKRAMGSDRAVADILAHVAMTREQVITRAEKARVGLALMGVAIQNPNTDWWMPVIPGRDLAKQQAALISMGLNPVDAANLVNQPTKRFIDPRTGMVRSMADNNLAGLRNVVTTRFQGKDYYLVFNEQNERAVRMAETLKNLNAQQLGDVLGNTAKVTRWFAAVNTQYNPIFGILNVTRDTGAAMLNLTTTPIAGRQSEVASNITPAMRGIWIALRDSRAGKQSRSQWAMLWDEFQNNGGRTGYRDMFATGAERAKALQAEMDAFDDGTAKRLGKGFMGLLTDFNDTLENSVRLAAYKAGKDNGMTAEQSAAMAKDLTVNFNRKGQMATQAGALYAFFNASAQGTMRLITTMRGPAGQKIAIGGLTLGAMQAMMLAAAGMDDEIPEFVKARNIIIPTGDGTYITIPMPLGFNVIPSVGRLATEFAVGGGKDAMKYTHATLDLLAETFNPIGNAGLSVQTIAPTFADPLVALSENRSWTGKPIAKEDRSSLNPTPGHTRAYNTASDFGKAVSRGLNWATGGSEYRPGMVSPTPDQIDYLVGQVTGGVGRELLKANETVSATVTGEELPPNKIPLVGRFIGNVNSQAATSTKFYENLTELNQHAAELKGREESGQSIGSYLKDNPEARFVSDAKKIERELSSLRKMKQKLIDTGAAKSSVKAIDQRITAQMDRLNKKVESVK